MNKLNTAERVQVLNALIEGNSINSTVRMTGISKPTILKLIRDFAVTCDEFHDTRVQALTSERIQLSEIWAFIGSKDQNTSPEKRAIGWGDAWTWTCIDADTKLMVTWFVGPRDKGSANSIMRDVASRLTKRVQVTTDGFAGYWAAVANAFECEADYAQLVKIYGIDRWNTSGKYSPPECIGTKIVTRFGNPDPKHVSTSYVERSNLTLRMGMRRYTRLTNGHSKKFENHVAMTSIFMTCYNWCRRHQSLNKQTPAMAAGLTDRKWDLSELVDLMSK